MKKSKKVIKSKINNPSPKKIILREREKMLRKAFVELIDEREKSYDEIKKAIKLSDNKLSQVLAIAWSQGIAQPIDPETKKRITFGKKRKSKYKESDLKISELNRFKAKNLFMIIEKYPGCSISELKILAELDEKSFLKCVNWLNDLAKIYIDPNSFIFSSELCERKDEYIF